MIYKQSPTDAGLWVFYKLTYVPSALKSVSLLLIKELIIIFLFDFIHDLFAHLYWDLSSTKELKKKE